ncbi:MAG: SH3 domain-containing protein [bacterium]|nr:SH3 domain-containing protein [bacterium]
MLLAVLSLFGVFAVASPVLAGGNAQQTRFVSPYLVANTSFLNIRSGPGIQYTVVLTVVGGTELPVLGVANDRTWYQVSTVIGPGWVNVQYTLPRGDFTNVPLVSVDSFAQPAVGLPQGGQPNVGTVGFGTGTVTGAVADDAIAVGGFTNQREFGVSVTVAHPLRGAPSSTSSSPQNINPDLSVIYTILEAANAEGFTWFRVSIPGIGNYWVEGPKTQLRPYACQLSAVRLSSDTTPGIGPDGSGTLNGNVVVRAGTEAYLLDARNGQYKLEFFDGSVGWVPETAAAVRDRSQVRVEYCTTGRPSTIPGGVAVGGQTPGAVTGGTGGVPRPRLTTPHVVVNTGFLNIRSGPGAQYTILATVAGGTELPVIGVYSDEVWYLVEGRFGRGWVNIDFVLFRGDGSTLPIIRDATGFISAPVAVVSTSLVLYAAPNVSLGTVGSVTGPLDLPIVARSADGLWVQVRTSIGFGWLLVDQVLLQGDLSLVPIVNG